MIENLILWVRLQISRMRQPLLSEQNRPASLQHWKIMKTFQKSIAIGVIVAFVLGSFIPSEVYGITVKEEEELSRQMLAAIYKQSEIIDDPAIVSYVNEIGNKILATLPEQPFQYHFHVIKEEVYNAFATPAGHIFVYSGLIEAMDEEEELAGILGH